MNRKETVQRRDFIVALGSAVVVPVLPVQRPAQEPSKSLSGRSRIELNGLWQRFVDGRFYDTVKVPSSLRPSGIYTLSREIVVPKLLHGVRAYLRFEGITYAARCSINGEGVGMMGPYVPYEFELTQHMKEGRNQIAVEIADLIPFPDGVGKDEIALGVNPGWEAYGGIIRDVYIELRPPSFIENVRFGYKLAPGFGSAPCHARVYVAASGVQSADLELVLKRETSEAARVSKSVKLTPGANEIDLTFDVGKPDLWTPAAPHLYDLKVQLKTGESSDTWSCRTGFRELKTTGREFQLNGERLVLKGVCRHDMWKDEGFTLAPAQRRQDMQMIKRMGCNYVRLVHYPHDRYVIDLADELGLFVTEEPGYWIQDFTTMPRTEIELGYRILENTIRRDWNAPSVFGWILSNESTLTTETLAEGKRRCNEVDPWRRFVSAANSHPKEEVKPLYEKAGMDFFDQHPYTFDLNQFEAEADFFGGEKPLVFTEWGGKQIAQSKPVMSDTVDHFIELTQSGKLAGHCFWSWQDLRQYSRIDPEMRNGVLESGVVSESRQPRDDVYMELLRLYEGRRSEEDLPSLRPEILPLRRIHWSQKSSFAPIPLDSLAASPQGLQAWAAFEANLAKYWASLPFSIDQWKRTGEKFQLWAQSSSDLTLSGLPFAVASVDGFARPLIASKASGVTIQVERRCSRIHVLGHAEFSNDFHGIEYMGQILGTMTLQFSSGDVRKIPLRSGYEIARANQIDDATRIEVVVLEAQPAIRYEKDFAREDYQFLLYSSPELPMERLESITYSMTEEHTSLAILAVTTES